MRCLAKSTLQDLWRIQIERISESWSIKEVPHDLETASSPKTANKQTTVLTTRKHPTPSTMATTAKMLLVLAAPLASMAVLRGTHRQHVFNNSTEEQPLALSFPGNIANISWLSYNESDCPQSMRGNGDYNKCVYEGEEYDFQWCHDECRNRSDCHTFEWAETSSGSRNYRCEMHITRPLAEDVAIFYRKPGLTLLLSTEWEFDPGYCRVDEEGQNGGEEGSDYFKYEGEEEEYDYDWCFEQCRKRTSCRAFEWTDSSNRCELWQTNPQGYASSNGSRCYRKPLSCGYEQYHGACLLESFGVNGGNEGTDFVVYNGQSFQWCNEKCDTTDACMAFEWSDSRCEIWTSIPRSLEPREGYSCYVRDC